MAQNTQHWPLQYYHETGLLGVFLCTFVSAFLSYWWFQQGWAPLACLGAGAGLAVLLARKGAASVQRNRLVYDATQGWLLVCQRPTADGQLAGSPVAVVIEHLWFGPYFCTLKLRLQDDPAPRPAAQYVVCWQWAMSAGQWRHLRVCLQATGFGRQSRAQSIKDQT